MSSHLCLGLPLDRAIRGVQLNILARTLQGIFQIFSYVTFVSIQVSDLQDFSTSNLTSFSQVG